MRVDARMSTGEKMETEPLDCRRVYVNLIDHCRCPDGTCKSQFWSGPAPSPATVDVGEARKLADEIDATTLTNAFLNAIILHVVATIGGQAGRAAELLRSLSTALETATDELNESREHVMAQAESIQNLLRDKAAAASALETEQAKVKGLEERKTVLELIIASTASEAASIVAGSEQCDGDELTALREAHQQWLRIATEAADKEAMAYYRDNWNAQERDAKRADAAEALARELADAGNVLRDKYGAMVNRNGVHPRESIIAWDATLAKLPPSRKEKE